MNPRWNIIVWEEFQNGDREGKTNEQARQALAWEGGRTWAEDQREEMDVFLLQDDNKSM